MKKLEPSLKYVNAQDDKMQFMKDNFPRVLSLLEYIKQNTDFMLASTNLSAVDIPKAKQFDNLPLRSTEEIANFDSRISLDVSLRSKLATYLSQIGGHSAKDNIVRILRRMFDNKVAQDCSWMGLRKNFRVGTLLTMTIIREAVEVNFPHSEKEFEEIASDWFRHAKQRYIRDQKKELTSILYSI